MRYLIAIKWISCMHARMGIEGNMCHCSKKLVMIFMCIPPWMSDVRIVSVTYHLASSSASTKG